MSNLHGFNLKDVVKGLLMAVIGAVLVTIQQAIMTGGLSSIDWRTVVSFAIGAALTYLIKQFFTDSQGVAFGIQATAPTQ